MMFDLLSMAIAYILGIITGHLISFLIERRAKG